MKKTRNEQAKKSQVESSWTWESFILLFLVICSIVGIAAQGFEHLIFNSQQSVLFALMLGGHILFIAMILIGYSTFPPTIALLLTSSFLFLVPHRERAAEYETQIRKKVVLIQLVSQSLREIDTQMENIEIQIQNEKDKIESITDRNKGFDEFMRTMDSLSLKLDERYKLSLVRIERESELNAFIRSTSSSEFFQVVYRSLLVIVISVVVPLIIRSERQDKKDW